MRFSWVWVVVGLSASGCAVGGEDVDGDGDGGITRKDSGPTDSAFDTAVKDTGSSSDTGASLDTGTTDTGSSLDTGSAVDTGSTTDTGSATDTGTTACTTLGAADCKASAEVLAAISGDTGSPSATRTGSDAAFFRVTITEDDSALLSSKDLKVRITLDSPAGENFDLYVYKGKAKGDGGAIECATVAKSSTTTGSDIVTLSWSDNRPIGGFDDSTPLSIEVRPTGTTCDPSLTWTLKIEGNK